jgi:hypothetical protein
MDKRTEQLEWLAVWYELWTLMTDTFTHSKPSDRASEIYSDRLADIPADRLRAAVEQCLATCRFFPTIADLREAAGLLGEDRFPTPIEAWDETCRAIRARARGVSFEWTSPLAEKVARAMDLYTLARSENPSTDRAHYLAAYREEVERARAAGRIVPKAAAAIASATVERKALGGEVEAKPSAPRGTTLVQRKCAACGKVFGVRVSDVEVVRCGECRARWSAGGAA